MASETNRDQQSRPKLPNPFGEQESQGDEQTRRAPGSEQEYQGNTPPQKRAPGLEEDDRTEGGGDRKSA